MDMVSSSNQESKESALLTYSSTHALGRLATRASRDDANDTRGLPHDSMRGNQ